MKKGLLNAFFSFLILSILVIGVSWYFVYNEVLIGPIFIFLGVINLLFLKFFNLKLESVAPDMVFGAIDNGILVFFAVAGGHIAGIAGAVIGGAAGNTITDGIGGLFEGHVAEGMRNKKVNEKRTALSTTLGKMAGCLFGAGTALIIVWAIRNIL